MEKVDRAVLQETKYIACWMLVLSAIMQAVFLIIGKWNYTVLLGNLLSGAASILNFFLMGLTVQRAVSKEQDAAKTTMHFSQLYRTLMLFAVAVVGVLLSCFNTWAVIIPLFFPRVAIGFRPFWKQGKAS